MKRTLIVISVMLVVLVLLVACGGKDSTTEKEIFTTEDNNVEKPATTTQVTKPVATTARPMATTASPTHTEETPNINAKPSEGLQYEYSAKSEGFYVSGMGTCQDSDVVIPKTHYDMPVIGIGWHAFRSTNIRSIVIPDTVTVIESNAFERCEKLTSVYIPNSVTKIESDAFLRCTALTSITIPSSVTEMGGLFSWCTNLKSATILANVEVLPSYMFSQCWNLTSVTLPSTLTMIDGRAFDDCRVLPSVVIPEGVTHIGERAFEDCYKLSSIQLPNSLCDYDYSAFLNTPLLGSDRLENGLLYLGNHLVYVEDDVIKCDIKHGTISIGGSAFEGGSIINITLPNTLKAIGQKAFASCNNIKTITIPQSVTYMGNQVFRDCDNLETVYCEATSQPSGWDEKWEGWEAEFEIVWAENSSETTPDSDKAYYDSVFAPHNYQNFTSKLIYTINYASEGETTPATSLEQTIRCAGGKICIEQIITSQTEKTRVIYYFETVNGIEKAYTLIADQKWVECNVRSEEFMPWDMLKFDYDFFTKTQNGFTVKEEYDIKFAKAFSTLTIFPPNVIVENDTVYTVTNETLSSVNISIEVIASVTEIITLQQTFTDYGTTVVESPPSK